MPFICVVCKLYALQWGKYGRLLLTADMCRLTVPFEEENAVKFAFLHPAVLQSQRGPFRSP